MVRWSEQRAHLKTHNLFYSAIHGEVDNGIVDLGYKVTGEYSVAENPKKGARCQPSFTLYNNENLIFVDIVSPGSITQTEIDRLSQYNNLDREAVENYLQRCDLSTPGYYESELDNFDFCFVMHQRKYDSHANGEATLRDHLDELGSQGTIVTVEPGNEVRKTNRGIHASDIDDRFQEGISIPETTGKFIHLPREIYQESLAVAICEEMVLGSDLSDGGISINEADVGGHFQREISYDKSHRVLEYLRKLNACRVKRDENDYTFTKYNLDVVLDIRNRLEKNPIDEIMSGGLKEDEAEYHSLSDFE